MNSASNRRWGDVERNRRKEVGCAFKKWNLLSNVWEMNGSELCNWDWVGHRPRGRQSTIVLSKEQGNKMSPNTFYYTYRSVPHSALIREVSSHSRCKLTERLTNGQYTENEKFWRNFEIHPKGDVFIRAQGAAQKWNDCKIEKRRMTPRKMSSRHNSVDPHRNL